MSILSIYKVGSIGLLEAKLDSENKRPRMYEAFGVLLSKE